MVEVKESSESQIELIDEEMREDADSVSRLLREVTDNDPRKILLITGLLFGSILKEMLEGAGVEIGKESGVGLPFCLPYTEDGEWDGVSFQMHALGILRLSDDVHLHGEKDEEDGD